MYLLFFRILQLYYTIKNNKLKLFPIFYYKEYNAN